MLCIVPGITDPCIGFWPSCAEIEIGCCVSSDFAIGYWVNLEGYCVYYCCADESGSGGYPWTCIAPGIGYPSGWQHPNVVLPDCVSMGIGVTATEDPSPVENDTWGEIKSLYRQ